MCLTGSSLIQAINMPERTALSAILLPCLLLLLANCSTTRSQIQVDDLKSEAEANVVHASEAVQLRVPPYATVKDVAGWSRQRQVGAKMRTEAARMLEASRKLTDNKKADCYKKFFVNHCLHELREQEVELERAARKLDRNGKALRRKVEREEFAAAEAYRLRESDALDMELAAETEKEEMERAKLQAKANMQNLQKRQEAIKGKKRRADEAAYWREKKEAHERLKIEKIRRSGEKKLTKPQ